MVESKRCVGDHAGSRGVERCCDGVVADIVGFCVIVNRVSMFLGFSQVLT